MPWVLFETAIGRCGLAWRGSAITNVQLPEATVAATRQRLASRAAMADATDGDHVEARELPAWVSDAIGRLRDHLAGSPQDLSGIPVDLARLPPFSARVYQALRLVPAGRTITYGELARAAGSPGAARAVGGAMAKNPLPILVPCHRVLAGGGGAGGFSAHGGLVTKARLLALEGRTPLTTAATSTATSAGASTATSPKRAARAPSISDGSGQLPFDPRAAITHLSAADPVLAKHIARVGPFRLRLEPTRDAFTALAESIVYQQLSGKAAATIFGRVRELFPAGALDASRLLTLDEATLRSAGLSRGKLASLRDLATRVVAGEIPSVEELERMEDEAIIERLTTVRGIGRWTVEMLLIFRLGRADILPVTDYGIRKAFGHLFRRRLVSAELATETEVERRGERWRPFRSVASWYLWRALDTPNSA